MSVPKGFADVIASRTVAWSASSLRVALAATMGLAGSPPAYAANVPHISAQETPSNLCRGLANIDLHMLEAITASRMDQPESRAWIDETLSVVEIPVDASYRPSPTADVVLRVRIPPGGIHSLDDRAVLWRERGGGWWIWRIQLDHRAPSPRPLTPPPADHPDPEAHWAQERANQRQNTWSPSAVNGPLSEREAAQAEALYADPCRAQEPVAWFNTVPLLRREEGRMDRLCPLDSAPVVGELREGTQRPRRLFAACANDTNTYRLMMLALAAGG